MSGIESIMKRDVVTIDEGETALAAARSMRAHNLGALLVLKGDALLGVFSERDLMNRVVAEGRNAGEVSVGEVCTRDPTTVLATTPVAECHRLITERGFRHLPICDEAQHPVGVISARDFMRFLLVEAEPEVSLEDVCKKLGELTALMARMEEHR